jgi:hypothetical protein
VQRWRSQRRRCDSGEVAGDGLESLLGDEAVEVVEERGEVFFVEVFEVVEPLAEVVVGGVERPAGDVVDEEVVEGHVEGFGDADQGVGGGGDAPGLIAADAAGVGADAFAELGLGPASFIPVRRNQI